MRYYTLKVYAFEDKLNLVREQVDPNYIRGNWSGIVNENQLGLFKWLMREVWNHEFITEGIVQSRIHSIIKELNIDLA